MIKLGKKGKLNKKSNKLLKQIFLDKGITYCEVCGTNHGLTFAHKEKRRNMTPEQLSDFNYVLLLCIQCHQDIEFSREKTEQLFRLLRT